jgi:hypothetical protein
MLTQSYRRMYKPSAAMITPEAVIKVLNQARVKYVLMGAHGIGGWRDEPRSTQDVDVLVHASHHSRAIGAIEKAFPDLVLQDSPAVTRFLDPADRKPVIDLMRPAEDLYREVFQAPVRVGRTHFVPPLEVALACKYAALLSPNRASEKRYLDAGDFVSMVKKNYDRIDKDVLFSLGEMVKNQGGPEIAKFVEDAYADRPLPL